MSLGRPTEAHFFNSCLTQAEPGSKLALGRVLALKQDGQFKVGNTLTGGGGGGDGGVQQGRRTPPPPPGGGRATALPAPVHLPTGWLGWLSMRGLGAGCSAASRGSTRMVKQHPRGQTTAAPGLNRLACRWGSPTWRVCGWRRRCWRS